MLIFQGASHCHISGGHFVRIRHEKLPPRPSTICLTSQLCKQASKTAKVSYQDNSTQLTSPYSSFRCSSISACCDLAAKYWSTCGQRPTPKKKSPLHEYRSPEKAAVSFSQPYRPLPTSKENASPTKTATSCDLPPPHCSQQISPVQIPPLQFQRFLPVPHHGWLVDQWHGAGSLARTFGNPWLEEIATKKKPFCWSCKSFAVLKVEVWCTTNKCGTERSASYFTSSSSNGGSFWEWILVLNYLFVGTSSGVLL